MTTKTKKMAKTKISSPIKLDKKELSKLEQKALEKWIERDEERIGPPKFKKIKDKTVAHVEKDLIRPGLKYWRLWDLRISIFLRLL